VGLPNGRLCYAIRTTIGKLTSSLSTSGRLLLARGGIPCSPVVERQATVLRIAPMYGGLCSGLCVSLVAATRHGNYWPNWNEEHRAGSRGEKTLPGAIACSHYGNTKAFVLGITIWLHWR